MSSDQEGTAFLVVIIDTHGHSKPTLQKMLKQCPDVFDQGSDSIEDYVERNISPELHKATALKVFMPRCACASEVYGSVFVCLCVCVCVSVCV